MSDRASSVGRRNFIKDSGLMIAGGAIGSAMALGKAVGAGTESEIRIAMIGCGRRARDLAEVVLNHPSVKLVALADAFGSQTQAMYRTLKGRHAERIAGDCVRASGMNSYREALECEADLVYLTAPPVFRPEHFRAAVESGKHCFLEKPIAADPSGAVEMRATAEQAADAGLSVHVGFQRAFAPAYQAVVAKIREGLIGRPVFARAYCNAGPIRKPTARPGESGEAYQIRNWNHFQWTGGDFLVEQHVAGLDAVRRALGARPCVAQGQGGWNRFERLAEAAENPGQAVAEVFDHHSVEYEFADGMRLLSQCRRAAKAWNHTGELIHGTEAVADLTNGKLLSHDGREIWNAGDSKSTAGASADNGTLAQQQFVLQSIQERTLVSDIDEAIDSTLMAMLGHRASLSGKREQWNRAFRASTS